MSVSAGFNPRESGWVGDVIACVGAFAPERASDFSRFESDQAGFNPVGERLVRRYVYAPLYRDVLANSCKVLGVPQTKPG